MVGVPGRSKGCKTCRRRKKGCDLQRPACGNCIRAGLTCEGYVRQWTFVENEAVVKGDATTVVAKRPPAKSPPLQFLPDALSRTAFEAKSVSLFWNIYFPANEHLALRSGPLGINNLNWISALRNMDLDDSALRPALLAVSLARIGQSYTDNPMAKQALKLYGTALREMNRALQDENRIQTDEILAAGKLMAAYEIITAIITRTPNFFTTDQWTTLPFEIQPKDPSDELHDVMATLPSLFAEYDLLAMNPNMDRAQHRLTRLFGQSRATNQALRQWHATLNARLPKPLPFAIRLMADVANDPDHDRFFAFKVCDHALAATVTLYWAGCSLLHSLIQKVFASLHSAGVTHLSRALPQDIDPRPFIASIAHSIAYFAQPEMGIWGAQEIGFPLGVALTYYATCTDPGADEERHVLGVSMERLTGLGLSLGTFLNSLQAASVTQPNLGEAESPWQERARVWFD
ncbi:MAG: hypothetical protein Q9220_000310 [cf. Caloplaca sp. 1 TL-2023]